MEVGKSRGELSLSSGRRLLGQEGQLSIFMGMVLLMIVSMLGFVINVGLFVHAKINLQNAVDAAAYAGAATQARLLTQMGYLNWEIRNNYKEWLFKYYVVGTLSNSKVINAINTDFVDFRPKPFDSTGTGSVSGLTYVADAFSKFNAPSVCINFGDTNICDITGIPGLPRFETVGMPAISEAHEQFLNKMVETKANNCIERSNLNFGTAMAWTYGKGGTEVTSLPPGTPPILIHLPGNWIKSIELGIRMRNLEFIINRPPIGQPICSNGDSCIDVNSLMQESPGTPLNERPVKAFLSAFKNLGGGKDNNSRSFYIKSNFKMTELAPVPIPINEGDLSGLLINTEAIYPSEGAYTQKYYADLLITPVNFLIFFTTFVAESTTTEVTNEGSCAQSLTGIPVPGYIMGFVKSNRAITYYAVKGETKYLGLFYPFTEDEGITLRAYAAAKPFGGRIGPYLFKYSMDKLKARDDTPKTVSYVAALKINSSGDYKPGLPIPFDSTFYITSPDDVIGGVPSAQDSSAIRFGIPNMVYDHIGEMSIHQAASGPSLIMPLSIWTGEAKPNGGEPPGDVTEADRGLYKPDQFKALQSSIVNKTGVSPQELNDAVIKAKRPTKYDALNYLVPLFDENETNLRLDTLSAINRENGNNSEVQQSSTMDLRFVFYSLFAPLSADKYMYPTIDLISSKMTAYLEAVKPSIDKFQSSLQVVAQEMRETATHGDTSTAGGTNYSTAANSLFPSSGDPLAEINAANGNEEACKKVSLAARFAKFFDTSTSNVNAVCGIVPVHINVVDYLQSNISSGGAFDKYYTTSYAIPDNATAKLLLTAYRPGPRQGANSDGSYGLPFNTSEATPVEGGRNYYSTKLIGINKVLSATTETTIPERLIARENVEGTLPATGQYEGFPVQFANPLEQGVIEEFDDFDDF